MPSPNVADVAITVTPCVGVWIEMFEVLKSVDGSGSLPAWECGLKCNIAEYLTAELEVTPCVGVWIEIDQ